MTPILLSGLHNSDNSFIYLFVCVIACVIIFGAFFSRAAIVKRKLKGTPEKKIAFCLSGEVVKVKGEIKYVGTPLTAPLSGRQCAYYYILVEEHRSSGKSSSWHTLIEEEVGADVVIKDGNQYALIETGMVKSHLIQDKQYSSGFLDDATEQLEKYLKSHGNESTGLFGLNKSLRYKEGILEEGELIAVAGKVDWKRKSEVKPDIPAERILVISRTDTAEPIYLSDDPEAVEPGA
jgi:hypothetical protein